MCQRRGEPEVWAAYYQGDSTRDTSQNHHEGDRGPHPEAAKLLPRCWTRTMLVHGLTREGGGKWRWETSSHNDQHPSIRFLSGLSEMPGPRWRNMRVQAT